MNENKKEKKSKIKNPLTANEGGTSRIVFSVRTPKKNERLKWITQGSNPEKNRRVYESNKKKSTDIRIEPNEYKSIQIQRILSYVVENKVPKRSHCHLSNKAWTLHFEFSLKFERTKRNQWIRNKKFSPYLLFDFEWYNSM